MRSYEELREGVMCGSSRGGHTGLVVLLREGMVAWLACAHEPCSPRRSPTPGDPSPPARVTSDDLQTSLVRVLANIAVAHREELPA